MPDKKENFAFIFCEYGYRKFQHSLWEMMVKETLDFVWYGQDEESNRRPWVCLPFGVAAYNSSEGGSPLLVKRDGNDKIHTALIVDTWL